MSASPLLHFLQSAACREHVNVKTMQCCQPTETTVVIRTSKTWDLAQPGRVGPAQNSGGVLLSPASWKPDWKSHFLLLLSDCRIWERPWRRIPPSGYVEQPPRGNAAGHWVRAPLVPLSHSLHVSGIFEKNLYSTVSLVASPRLVRLHPLHRPQKLTH